MKLKLKLSKTLKRQLKEQAALKEMERNDYVISVIKEHIQSKKELWQDTVEDYPAILEKRQSDLILLKESHEEKELPVEERRAELKAFYSENHMYLDFENKNRKFENLILQLDETDYYALKIIADDSKVTLESYSVTFLHHLVK